MVRYHCIFGITVTPYYSAVVYFARRELGLPFYCRGVDFRTW